MSEETVSGLPRSACAHTHVRLGKGGQGEKRKHVPGLCGLQFVLPPPSPHTPSPFRKTATPKRNNSKQRTLVLQGWPRVRAPRTVEDRRHRAKSSALPPCRLPTAVLLLCKMGTIRPPPPPPRTEPHQARKPRLAHAPNKTLSDSSVNTSGVWGSTGQQSSSSRSLAAAWTTQPLPNSRHT